MEENMTQELKPLPAHNQINIKEFSTSCIIKAISLCTLKSNVNTRKKERQNLHGIT